MNALEARLLAAIQADTHGDAPRLAYADYLIRQGDPRGEYIRLEVESEHLQDGSPEKDAMNERVNELLTDYHDGWAVPLQELGLSMGAYGWTILYLERGMTETLWIDAPGVLPEQADRLFALAPAVHEIRILPEAKIDIAALARCPYLRQIEILDLCDLDLNADAVGVFLASPHLTKLRNLEIGSNSLGRAGAKHLARCPALSRIEKLGVHACKFTDRATPDLAKLVMPRLTDLNLSFNAFGSEGLPALLAGRLLANVKTLDLSSCDLGPEGFELLARSPLLAKLTELDLSNNDTGPDGAIALAGCPYLGSIETLDLSSNYFEDDGLIALATAAPMPRLRKLNLALQKMGRRGLEALARWPGLARIEELGLQMNQPGDEGVAALAESPHVGALRILDLNETEIGPVAALALATSRTLSSLAELNLRGNDLGAEGAEHLVAGDWPALTKLQVSALQVEEAGEARLQERFGERIDLE